MFLGKANSFAEKCGSGVLDGTFIDTDLTVLQNRGRQTLPAHPADGQNIIDMPPYYATDQKVNQRYCVLGVNSTFPS